MARVVIRGTIRALPVIRAVIRAATISPCGHVAASSLHTVRIYFPAGAAVRGSVRRPRR